MAETGGRTPWDQEGALIGPARVVWAPLSVAVPDSAWDIVSPVAVSGEYPLATGWVDFGLAVNGPIYDHARTVLGVGYQQPSQDLFQQVDKVTRKFTADVAEFTPGNLIIVENTQDTAATVAAASGKSSGKKVRFGLYSTLQSYRVAMISYRPDGVQPVTEPGGLKRPPAAVLVLPKVQLGANNSQMQFDRGKPTNAPVEFEVFPETTLPAGFEHGFWWLEDGGVTIA